MRTVPVMGNSGITANNNSANSTAANSSILSTAGNSENSAGKERVTLTGYEVLREGGGGGLSGNEEGSGAAAALNATLTHDVNNTTGSKDKLEGKDFLAPKFCLFLKIF